MRKSLTLIELIITIVVISIAFPALFMFFSSVVRVSHENETVFTATKIAGCYIEEIRSKRFDENTSEPYTSPGALGYDSSTNGLDDTTAENGTDHDNWDDVDDYDGFSAPSDDDSSYTVEIDVFYVDGSDLNTSVGSQTDYKHVNVKISHSPDIEVETHALITPLDMM